MSDGGSPAPGDVAEPERTPDLEEALRQLYDAYGAALLSYLMRLTKGDRHLAEDLLQETLIRAWRHPEARTDGAWSRPWLFMVARRITIDHVRSTLARPAEVNDVRLEDRPDADDSIDRIADEAQILDVVLALTPRHRDVLVELYLHDRSVAQTAEILGIPEGTVKSRSFYALRELRARFTERGMLSDEP